MTDGIRSLLINCSHLKELLILSNIRYFSLSIIFKNIFQVSPMHFSDFYILSDLQGNSKTW